MDALADTTPFSGPLKALNPKQRLMKRWAMLKVERQTWFDHWRDLSEQIRPRGSRFLYSERNKGWKVNSHIINGTPMFAERTLAAGMMSGITSPARPWFRLTTPDPALDEMDDVKLWLRVVEDRLRIAFARSNIYNVLHILYSDLGVHGTSCIIIEEDDDNTLRAYALPIGQYCLALSEKGVVDTVFREVSLTVKQMVRRFGKAKCSQQVQTLFENGDLDTWVLCLHVIEPNEDYEPGRLLDPKRAKKWKSVWLEQGGDTENLLKESGYDEFPCMAPRWNVTGEDVYGDSPGMAALGDCRALQLYERRAAQLADKAVDPPMRAPSAMKNTRASLLPGDVTYVDATASGATFAPAYEIKPEALNYVETKIQRHELRVNKAFYADLWLMLSQSDTEMTAREVVERREEKLLQLGTVLERLQLELLDPMITRSFNILWKKGLLPPPPKQLRGRQLRVEYISIMAQAQKLLGTTGIERLSTFVANLAPVVPTILDNVDFDHVANEYSGMLGVPPVVLRTDEDVAKVRADRAKQQAAAQQQAQLAQAAQTAKTASQADMSTENPNALTTMLQGLGVK